MKLFLPLICFLISFGLFAKTLDLSKSEILSANTSEKVGVSVLREFIEEGRFVKTDRRLIVDKANQVSNPRYERGDFVIMWAFGPKDMNMTQTEYTRLWNIMKYLSDLHFRVIMNIQTTKEDLRDAVESDTTSVILISSHGNTDGFYDINVDMFPYDIFKNKGKSLYQLIISACYGSDFIDHYNIPDDILVWKWAGETNTNQMMSFLLSNKWDVLEHAK